MRGLVAGGAWRTEPGWSYCAAICWNVLEDSVSKNVAHVWVVFGRPQHAAHRRGLSLSVSVSISLTPAGLSVSCRGLIPYTVVNGRRESMEPDDPRDSRASLGSTTRIHFRTSLHHY
ncbi:hypothetical protein J6590_034234 [Homalodisca vitripennis]|nr:hypothetical protein J6590_034234 [Homalodisca vitripennis]